MTDPNRKIRILCFGDSNTWGYDPRDQSRYPESVRWTGLLQQTLGPRFQIIEEGLNGRTTVSDYKDRVGKNGRDYLRPCMDSHFPIDLVILGLGTNDTKVGFNLSAEQISQGLEELIQIILGKGLERPSPNVKLLVAAPPLVSEVHLKGFADLVGAEAKTRELPALYGQLAEKYSCAYSDLTKVASPSAQDGCHLDPEAHARIAGAFSKLILELFKS